MSTTPFQLPSSWTSLPTATDDNWWGNANNGSYNPTVSYSNPSLFNGLNGTIAGLAGAAGAFPTPGSSTTNSNQTTNSSQASTPILSAQNQALLNQLGDQYSHLASTGTNLQPYEEQQSQNINNNANIASTAANQALAARGLAGSPVAGTVNSTIGNNRIGAINQLQSSIPLLSNQLNLANLGAASAFQSSIPKGTSTTGTSNTTGTSTTQTKSGGGIGGFLGGLGSAIGGIAGIFSDKRLKENVSENMDGLKKVLAMKPKMYNYKDDPTGEVHSGFMADDLEKIFPEVVNQHPSGYKMVKYHELIPKVVKAMQELNQKVEEVSKNTKNVSQPKEKAA